MGLRIDRLGHEGHDVRLRNRLLFANRHRAVAIGIAANLNRHEEMTRNLPHGFQDPGIPDIPGLKLPLDHLLTLTHHLIFCSELVFAGPGGTKREHQTSQDQDSGKSHCLESMTLRGEFPDDVCFRRTEAFGATVENLCTIQAKIEVSCWLAYWYF